MGPLDGCRHQPFQEFTVDARVAGIRLAQGENLREHSGQGKERDSSGSSEQTVAHSMKF
jgi:hypothetical protein